MSIEREIALLASHTLNVVNQKWIDAGDDYVSFDGRSQCSCHERAVRDALEAVIHVVANQLLDRGIVPALLSTEAVTILEATGWIHHFEREVRIAPPGPLF